MAGVSQAELRVILSAQDSASRTIHGLGGALTQLGGSAKQVTPSFLSMSTAMAAGTVAANVMMMAVGKIGGAIGGAVKSSSDFGQSMANIRATVGETNFNEFGEQLKDTALRLGKDYPLSAAEAGNAMELLAQKGISASKIIGGGAEAVVKLASATGGDLVTSAGIAAAALDTFQIAESDINRVTDVMTASILRGGMSASQYGLAMKQAGGVVKLAGGSIEDVSIGLAAMAKAGIEGSDAGTSLKAMYLNLIPTEKKQIALARELGIITEDGSNQFFDAAGNAKNYEEISGVLANSLKDLTKQQKLEKLETLFGSDAIRSAGVAAEFGAGKYGNLGEQIRETGIATKAAAARMDSLEGDTKQLSGSIETLAIKLGAKLEPAMRGVTQFATRFANELIGMSDRLKFDAILAAATDQFKRFGDGLYAAGQNASTFGDRLKTVPVIGQFINREFNVLGSVLTGVAAVLRGDAAGAVEAFGNAAGQAGEGFSELATFVDGKVKEILGFVGKLVGITFGPDATSEQMWNRLAEVAGAKLDEIGGKFDVLGQELAKLKIGDDIKASFDSLAKSAATLTTGMTALGTAMNQVNQASQQTTGFGAIANTAKIAATGVFLLTVAFADLLLVAGSLFDMMGTSLKIFGSVGAALDALSRRDLGAFKEAMGEGIETADAFKVRMGELGGALTTNSQSQAEAVRNLFAAFGEGSSAMAKTGEGVRAFREGTQTAVAASAAMAAGFDNDQAEIAAGWAVSTAASKAAVSSFDADHAELAGSFDQTVNASSEAVAAFGADHTEIAASFASVAPAAEEAMGSVATATEAGMTEATAAVVEGGSQIEAAAVPAFTATAAAAEESMPALVAATEDGMGSAQAAVVAAAPVMSAAMGEAGAGMVAATSSSMADLTSTTSVGMAEVTATVNAEQGPAAGAASAIGSAIVSGLTGAIFGGIGQVASAAATLVTSAINAARAAADAHSPSKKTEQLGVDMWEGLNQALAAGKIDQGILNAVRDYADAARDYLPVAAEIARVEEEIGRVRERYQVDALFRELAMVDATSHLLSLKRDLAEAEAALLPTRQALASAEREVRGIEGGSLLDRQKMLDLDRQRSEIRLKEIDLEKQLIGLPRDSKQAKAIQAELDALRDKARALQLESDRIRTVNQVAAADAKMRREIAGEAVAQGEAAQIATRDQIAVLDALAAVFTANEAIIKNTTDNEIKQWQRVKAVFEAQGKPIQERIEAGLQLIDQLEKEGAISGELAGKLRALAKTAGAAAKTTEAAVGSATEAVNEAVSGGGAEGDGIAVAAEVAATAIETAGAAMPVMAEQTSAAFGQIVQDFNVGLPAAVTASEEATSGVQSAFEDTLPLIIETTAEVLADMIDVVGENMDAVVERVNQAFKDLEDIDVEVEGRAAGGMMKARQPYMVGEKGPELVTPRVSSMVTPNKALGGGQTIVNNFNINADARDRPQIQNNMSAAMFELQRANLS